MLNTVRGIDWLFVIEGDICYAMLGLRRCLDTQNTTCAYTCVYQKLNKLVAKCILCIILPPQKRNY